MYAAISHLLDNRLVGVEPASLTNLISISLHSDNRMIRIRTQYSNILLLEPLLIKDSHVYATYTMITSIIYHVNTFY